MTATCKSAIEIQVSKCPVFEIMDYSGVQVNERGHIAYGKKRAFILTNETRLLAFI